MEEKEEQREEEEPQWQQKQKEKKRQVIKDCEARGLPSPPDTQARVHSSNIY